jgi:hypothetical protein
MRHIDRFSLAFIIWICILLVLGPLQEASLLVILALIGFLVLRELFDFSLDASIKERMDFFMYVGVVFFMIVVAQKVMEILQGQ